MTKHDRTPSNLSGNFEQRAFARELIASIVRRKQLGRAQEELYRHRILAFPGDVVDKTKLQKLCYFAALELDSVQAMFPEMALRNDLDWQHGPVHELFYYEMDSMIREGLIEEIPVPGSDRVLLRLSPSGEEWFSRNPPQQAVQHELSNWGRMINISNITVKAKVQYLKNIGSAGLQERPKGKAHSWEVVHLLTCAFVMASIDHPERKGYVTPYVVAETYGIPESTAYKFATEMLRVGLLTRNPVAAVYGRKEVKPTPELIRLFEAVRSRYQQKLLNRRIQILNNKREDPEYLF